MRILLVGGGAREHALGEAIHSAPAELVVVSPTENPGLAVIAEHAYRAPLTDAAAILKVAQTRAVDLAVLGPEAPIAAGVADVLRGGGIPVVGPSRAAARIESSKRFCRELLARHSIDASPRWRGATTLDELGRAIAEVGSPFVVKPVSLTSGKGVLVQGSDFATAEEGARLARRMLSAEGGERGGLLVEEKLEGEEFSLMAFVSDGTLYPMPLVQDYKRALEGGQGPNTGGMGSYSQRDHLLPFLSELQYEAALATMRAVVKAMVADDLDYRGVLYGGFMLTASGPKLLEFNARFGDPESLNALTLLERGNFATLLSDIAHGRRLGSPPSFRLRASVVKYAVPVGYGGSPQVGALVGYDPVAIERAGVRLYFGAVEAAGPDRVRFSSSRGLALVGEASAIWEAGTRVEEALKALTGPFYARHDIASREDLTARVEHMRQLLSPGAKASPLPLSVAAPTAPAASHAKVGQLI
ncbi:MAG: phosphoribosylamine--glycine ligase [Thermoplasmata archaeon]|nr:phosphoribosylamine--glycine ligase [Thermoplasmata archaeon]MCI4341714.1 phosphoribosylamine--glycine ligase [Thermoplasmata archaeon]